MQNCAYRRTKQSDLHKVYERAEDKNISTVVVFSNSDCKCCADAECIHEIDSDTLNNLFLKGFVILYEDAFFKPVAIYQKNGRANVIAITLSEDSEGEWVLDYLVFQARKPSEVLEDPEEEA